MSNSKPKFTLAELRKLVGLAVVAEVPDALSASLVINVGEGQPRVVIPVRLPKSEPAELVGAGGTISDC